LNGDTALVLGTQTEDGSDHMLLRRVDESCRTHGNCWQARNSGPQAVEGGVSERRRRTGPTCVFARVPSSVPGRATAFQHAVRRSEALHAENLKACMQTLRRAATRTGNRHLAVRLHPKVTAVLAADPAAHSNHAPQKHASPQDVKSHRFLLPTSSLLRSSGRFLLTPYRLRSTLCVDVLILGVPRCAALKTVSI
jgi:hypothetical protein